MRRKLQLSENALKVLERRYLAKDENGNVVETPVEMFERVAKTMAEVERKFDPQANVEQWTDEFYNMMASLDFLPNSPTLMNAGRPLGQLSACFVLPVGDSMEEIFDAVKQAALIHKSGGGTGFSFSRLRPAGATVKSTGGVASGPVSFMRVFDAATEAVKQGGTRRGANMGMLRVDHPDILEFISCKQDTHVINNFNISVAITDAFMEAVENDGEYDLIDPHTKQAVKRLRAREVFDKIVEMAWLNGEPGVFFIDEANRKNPTPQFGEIEATNPCAEQALLPYESCNLGSINLSHMVCESKDSARPDVDWEKLAYTVQCAVRFLDNVIDANHYPLDIIRDTTRRTRKIGLGVMGWAEMLFKLGVTYGSEASLTLADKVMGLIEREAWKYSNYLREMRGTPDGVKTRNAAITTVAPTGTISIIAGTSSGIEPLFALAFTRNVMDNDELPEVNGVFASELKAWGLDKPDVVKEIARRGTIHDMESLPRSLRDVYVTAHDISPESHIKMQAAFQQHVDSSISKTINFKHDATIDDVRRAYMLAWKSKLKGLTVYRDGSRDSQVLVTGTPSAKKDAVPAKAEPSAKPQQTLPAVPRPRPETTMGITEKVKIGCGNLYVTVNYDEHGICEVFTNLGRGGGCPSQSEATSRLISTALRSGMKPETLIEQLRGIRCHSTLRQKGLKVLSCPDAIGRVIEKAMKMRQGQKPCAPDEKSEKPRRRQEPSMDVLAPKEDSLCPECGSTMEHESGCAVCRSCGFSHCG